MIRTLSLKWFKYLPNKFMSIIYLIPFIKEYYRIQESEIIFFFPTYHTGGAERVHLDIINCFKNSKTYIFFESTSNSNINKKEFTKNSNYYEIFEFLNRSRFIRKLLIIFLIKIINNSKSTQTIFASYSSFFYKLLPSLNDNIKKIDLTHSFSLSGKGIEFNSLPYVPYISNRVVINNKTLVDFKNLYKKHNLDNYINRIKVIQNGVSFDNIDLPIKEKNKIKICYVGRWSEEKRPELFLKIAKKIAENSSRFNFSFIGTDDNLKRQIIEKHNVECIGELTSKKDLIDIYKEFHYIFITSIREGFPMVLMEAMSFGVVPVCTNVGGIYEHITNNKNGLLINNNVDEKIIITKFIETINYIQSNNKFNSLSQNSFNYARENFGLENFQKSYKELIL